MSYFQMLILVLALVLASLWIALSQVHPVPQHHSGYPAVYPLGPHTCIGRH